MQRYNLSPAEFPPWALQKHQLSIKRGARSPCGTPVRAAKHHYATDMSRRGRWCANGSGLVNLILLKGSLHCSLKEDEDFFQVLST